jgi:CheY-like chemotaxis protein
MVTVDARSVVRGDRPLRRLFLRILADAASAIDALREFSPDVILAGFTMPGYDGMAAAVPT